MRISNTRLWPLWSLFAVLTLMACTSPPPSSVSATQIVTREVVKTVPVTVVVTRIVKVTVPIPVTVVVTPTFTPGPSPTPTASPSPTITPTPFQIAGCREFVLKVTDSTTAEDLEAQAAQYHRQCVKVLYIPRDGVYTADMLSFFSQLYLRRDEVSPPLPKEPAFLYGIFYAGGTEENPSKEDMLLLRRADVLPPNQRPLMKAGLFLVGKDGQMAPGRWKSARLPTDTDSCYWARHNPKSGQIKDNHFGLAGIVVQVYEGEVFETNEECLPWIYLGP